MDTKKKILIAIRELFFKLGIKRVTMDEIATQLGISKKTLYQHFEDKDQMIDEMVELTIEEQKNQLCCIGDESQDPIHEIIQVGKFMAGMLSKINPVFFYDMKKYYPKQWRKFQSFKHDYAKDQIVENLKKGVSLGLYRPDLNIEIIAQYRIVQIDIILQGEAFDAQHFNLADLGKEITELFMHGIATLKGHKLINKYKEVTDDE